MLSIRNFVVAAGLLLCAGFFTAGHQVVGAGSILADGSSPLPPVPLVQPGRLMADGSSPLPPPVPLATPGQLLADGSSPLPPPVPLAVPDTPATDFHITA